jgi:hypothetical protein
MQIDYTEIIKAYQESEPSDLDGFTVMLSEQRGNMTKWRGMMCYTLWRMVYKNVLRLNGATQYVKDNMSSILGKYSDNKDYVVSLAGVVDSIFCDMWRMYQDELPYLDKDSNPISIESVIFTPNALTNAYTFKGFWRETFKWEEQGLMSFDDAYEIRQALLRMFLENSREDIKAFQKEVRAEVIKEQIEGNPVTVMEVSFSQDLQDWAVQLQLDDKAFSWLEQQLFKKYGVSLKQLGEK